MNERDSKNCQDLSHQKSSTVISKRARRNNNTTRYYRRKSNAIERGLSRRSHNLWIRRGLHHSISTNQSRDYPTTPPQGRLVRSSTDQRYIVQLYQQQPTAKRQNLEFKRSKRSTPTKTPTDGQSTKY